MARSIEALGVVIVSPVGDLISFVGYLLEANLLRKSKAAVPGVDQALCNASPELWLFVTSEVLP